MLTNYIKTDPVSTIQFLKVTALQYNVWNEDGAFITSHTVTYRFIRKSVPKELLYRFFLSLNLLVHENLYRIAKIFATFTDSALSALSIVTQDFPRQLPVIY